MTTLTKPEYKTPADLAETQQAADAAPTVVTPSALIGTWINSDTATRGLVKVVVAAAGAGITVDAFGACTPTPCNWGAVAGVVSTQRTLAHTPASHSAQITNSASSTRF